jgi:hypothetical protein
MRQKNSPVVNFYQILNKNRNVIFLWFYSYDAINLEPDKIDLYCRWLYQTPRADGKPRVLLIGRENSDSAPISLLIDRIKQVGFLRKDLPL